MSASGLTNYYFSTSSTGLYSQEAIDSGSWGYALAEQTTIVAENSIQGSCYASVLSNGTNALGQFSYINGYASSQLETHFGVAKDTPYALSGVVTFNFDFNSDSSNNGWGSGGIRPGGTSVYCNGCYLYALWPGYGYGSGSTAFSTNGVLSSGNYVFNLDAGDLTLRDYHEQLSQYTFSILFTFSTVPIFSTSLVTNRLTLQWPSIFTNFVLETTSDASFVSPWSAVSNDVTVQGDLSTVAVDTSSPARFFRMRSR